MAEAVIDEKENLEAAEQQGAEQAAAAAPAPKRRKNKRTVSEGHIHVLATFNNTLITITDTKGNTLSTGSAGAAGFRGSKKGTAYAAQVAAEKAIDTAKQNYGLSKADVFVKGVGLGRDAAVRTLINQKIQIENIRDITGIPHGGVRPRKAKRNSYMARESRPVVKLSRREGYALHPKAHKALVKRPGPPGQRGNYNGRQKNSQYSLQLREKQKVKRLYGLLERQFSKLMEEASRTRGQSGATLLEFLERRLDNVIYRAGFAPSRNAARQLATHGHFMLNGKRVDVPSIRLNAGDKLVLRDPSKKNEYFKQIDELSPAPGNLPGWIKVSRKQFSVEVTGNPARDDAEPDIKEQLIVEYYSR